MPVFLARGKEKFYVFILMIFFLLCSPLRLSWVCVFINVREGRALCQDVPSKTLSKEKQKSQTATWTSRIFENTCRQNLLLLPLPPVTSVHSLLEAGCCAKGQILGASGMGALAGTHVLNRS